MPEIGADELKQVAFDLFGSARHTQDSCILPDVWGTFLAEPGTRQPVLIEAKRGAKAGALAKSLHDALTGTDDTEPANVAPNERIVAADLTFIELLTKVVPKSNWWLTVRHETPAVGAADIIGLLEQRPDQPLADVGLSRRQWQMLCFMSLAGLVLYPRGEGDDLRQLIEDLKRRDATYNDVKGVLAAYMEVAPEIDEHSTDDVWLVTPNRAATLALSKSRKAVKADACERVFDVRGRGITWAVVDSGIDATHPAFRDRSKSDKRKKDAPSLATGSRVLRTFDFTRVRDIIAGNVPGADGTTLSASAARRGRELKKRLKEGLEVDWEMLIDLIEIRHGAKEYRAPKNDHGTHVAGIIGGHWPAGENPEDGEELTGVAPEVSFIDLRVFDEQGKSDEYIILSALQFIGHLNRSRGGSHIHGANLSFSVGHDVRNYACGRTPVCMECEHLVGDGVVVVAAAGNRGAEGLRLSSGVVDRINDISLTDPGNAQCAITVGSTHKSQPHSYGVSYFSSRGPTSDGRMKPDLVAPGEKITAPVPGGRSATKDGTSMAAPHVSGAAALLLDRNRELIGSPDVVKRRLCEAATDLGRDRQFQGAGMLDILRAMQLI